MSDEIDIKEVLKRLEVVEHKLGIYHIENPDLILEEMILKAKKWNFETATRNFEENDLALGVIGFKADTLKALKAHFSKNRWKTLCEDINSNILRGVRFGSIKEAQVRLLSVVYRLEEMGEMVIPKEMDNLKDSIKKFEQVWADINRKEEGLETWKKEVLDNLENV